MDPRKHSGYSNSLLCSTHSFFQGLQWHQNSSFWEKETVAKQGCNHWCYNVFPDFIWEFSSFRLPRSQTTQPLTWTSLKITTTSCSAARTTTSMPSTDPTGRRRTLNLQVWWQFKQRDWSWFTRNLFWQKLWRVSVTWSPKARRRRRSEKEKRSEGRLHQCSPPPPPTPHTPHTLHNL